MEEREIKDSKWISFAQAKLEQELYNQMHNNWISKNCSCNNNPNCMIAIKNKYDLRTENNKERILDQLIFTSDIVAARDLTGDDKYQRLIDQSKLDNNIPLLKL